jgi:hypothetical protein
MPNEPKSPGRGGGRSSIRGRPPSPLWGSGSLGTGTLGLAPQATCLGSFRATHPPAIERTESSGVSPFSHPTAGSAQTGFASSPPPFSSSRPFFYDPDSRLAIPPVFLASRPPVLLGRPFFQLPERPSFWDGHFFSVPGHHLSSPSGILASRTAIFESGAPSFFLERHLSSGAGIFLPGPSSG